MNPSQEKSWECLQQAIDVEIKSLEESIRALKSRRNAYSPISSLPPEVFATIFSFLCLPGNDVPGRPDSRLLVSHVCHQWREIALNQPLLWSRIDFTSLSFAGTAAIFDRAKSAPLYLKARIPDRLRISAKPALLHITLIGLTSPAPNLEYLSLSSCRGHHGSRLSRHGGRSSIPDTLFDCSTPRLSHLELCDCNISWRSPLLKGLKRLKILTPSANSRPELAVWLSALDEMPHLTTLTLHLASPISPPFPFDVNRTVALPSLTRLELLASPEDCALALAHLDLPALSSLSLTVQLLDSDTSNVQRLLPFVVRHVYGPQDAQPLRCVLIRSEWNRVDILAWPTPNIEAKVVHDLRTLLPTMLPTRVSLSFRFRDDQLRPKQRLEILRTVLADLPLDGLVMLDAGDLNGARRERDLQMQHFWNHLSQKWPFLQCVRLSAAAARGFTNMLDDDDNQGRDRPSLPSLSQLVMVEYPLDEESLYHLYSALRKRVKQGVPVERLDLRQGFPHPLPIHPDFSTVVVDVLGPEESSGAWAQPGVWAVVHDPFLDNDHSVTGSDDDHDE